MSFLLLSTIVCAQKYNTIGGIRIGDDFGISFAQRIFNKTTAEINIQPGTFEGKQMLTILAKQHSPLLSKRINFFIGGGYYLKKYPTDNNSETPSLHTSSGIAFTLGAEITLGNLSISTDYLPLVTFKSGTNQRFQTTSGLSLRYVFVSRESSTKKFFKNLFKKKK